jgi:hypothetical protein
VGGPGAADEHAATKRLGRRNERNIAKPLGPGCEDGRSRIPTVGHRIDAATPPGWWVGHPCYHDERDEWLLHAFDPSERAVVGVRSREWTAKASTKLRVVREMARCLRELRDGRSPR